MRKNVCDVCVLCCIGMSLVFPQPFYSGPASYTTFTPASFSQSVEENKGKTEWIVEFFAPWSPNCLSLEPVFAEISNQFSSDEIKFGKVDISRWPAMATKFNIQVTGVADQLPTIIKFSKGKEVSRIPYVSSTGKVSKGKYRRADILAVFDLEE